MKHIIRTTKTITWRTKVLAAGMSFVLAGQTGGFAQEGIDFNEAERMMGFQAVELRDQLVFGLRCNLPEQTQFIDQVIARVDSGELSRSMVNVVFVWAKKRNPRIPYPYFEIVLRMLAEKRGVTLPATNSIQIATAF